MKKTFNSSLLFLSTFILFVSLFTTSTLQAQIMGKSLDFATDGDSYVQLTGDNDFGKVSNFQEEFTFEAWVKAEDSKTWSRVFDFGDSTNDWIIFTTKADEANQYQCQVAYRTGGATVHRLNGGIFPTAWTHVAITFAANGDVKLYLNGNLQSSTNWPTKINYIYGTTKNYLGKSQFGQDPEFEGKLDEVRVWKEVRTQTEIQDWQYCELAGDDENLIAYFNMNQGLSTGPNVLDNTINNFGKLSNGKGTLQNFALVGDNGNWINSTPMTDNAAAQNCFELDGTDGFKLSNKHNHDFDDAYTIEYWYKPNLNIGNQLILSKGDEYQQNLDFYMNHVGNDLAMGQYNPQVQTFTVAYNALELGKWQHIAGVTYEENGGITNEIYVNGILKGTKFHPNQSLTNNNYEVRVGRGNNKPVVGNVNGKISNLRFWNKKRLATDIAQNMSTNYTEAVPGLVSQYNTYTNIDQGLVDNIGNSHGTFLNTPYFSNDPCFVRFIQEPQDQTMSINGGETITFTADVEECHLGLLTYQWQKDGVNIDGATSLTYSIPAVSDIDQGVYKLNVTACDQVFSTRRARLIGNNPGTVLSFDGKDDYMKFDASALNSVPALTIETWVKFNSIPQNENIIVLTNNQGVDSYYTSQIRVNKDGYAEHSTLDDSNDNETKTVRHPEKLIKDKWYHIRAKSVTNGNISISINGVVSNDTEQLGNNIAPGGFFLVGHPACGHDYFDGEMSELRIWKSDVNTNYNDPELTSGSNDLLHYYDFSKGVANGNNSSLSPDIQDPFYVGGNLAELHNFTFMEETSNWVGCGQFEPSFILQQSSPFIKNFGDQAEFIVFVPASFSDNRFQWYKDQVAIPGATNSKYIIENVVPSDIGSYHATLENPGQCRSVSESREMLVNGSGEVLNFDGVDDHVVVEATPSNETTLMMWVKVLGDSTLLSLIQGSNDLGPKAAISNQLYTDEEGFICFYSSSTGTLDGNFYRSDQKLTTNEWHHIAVLINAQNGERTLMIDGAEYLIDGISFDPNYWTGLTNYHIGTAALTNLDGVVTALKPFEGEIDDVRIYNRQLSPIEAAASMDFEVYSSEYFSCNCTGPGPSHSLKFNQGFANESNESQHQFIVDFVSIFSYSKTSAIAHNFSWNGEVSNWSNCSPITAPQITIDTESSTVITLGSEIIINAPSNTDDDLLSYQWSKDGVIITDADSNTYIIDNLAQADSGYYEVIVADQCNPINTDTIGTQIGQYIDCLGVNGVSDTMHFNVNHTYMPFDSLGQQTGFLELYQIFDGGYCDTNIPYEDEEIIYILEVTEPAVVEFDLYDHDVDLDLFVVSECNIDECYGVGINEGLQDEHVVADIQEPGTYYVIIEKKSGPAANSSLIFKLDVSFFEGKCYAAEQLECGTTVSDNTASGTHFVTAPCGLTGYTGNEKIYEITVDTSSTISAIMSNMSADLDLFLLDSLCNDISCLAQSTNTGDEAEQIIQGVPAGTYYLVVDGKDGAEGTFELTVNCNEYFEVSVDDNDAYIDLNWSIDKSLCVPQDTGVIIRILTTPSTILYEEEFATAALTPDIIQGTYRHYVGTDHTRLYKLRVYNKLSNTIICDLLRTGSTTSFQKPEILDISTATDPDSIRVTWRNLSKLSDEFRLYRDGQLIANLTDGYTEDSLIISHVDVHNINNPSSIQQDSSYEYCLETYSTQLSQVYGDTCGLGATYAINLEATNLIHTDKVVLNWSNISPFCDMIKIERDGIFLEMLSKNETSYTDLAPIYGLPNEYSLTMITGDVETMEVFASGSVAPHGVISGSVFTQQGDYAIKDVTVILSKITESGSTVLETQLTDFTGAYKFSDVVYGLSQDFEVSVNKTGSSFDPETRPVTLNEAVFEQKDIDFFDQLPIVVSEIETLVDDFTYTTFDDEDYVKLDWSYTYDAADTLFFNLYRNGNLILNATDASGSINSYTDLTGVPDSTYQYILQIHNPEAGDILTQELTNSLTYPSVTPLTNMDIILGEGTEVIKQFDPSIILDWSSYGHLSQNFDGFRIFRDGIEVGVVDSSGLVFSHLTEPGSTATYQVKAFRVIGGIVHESVPYPSVPVSITSNSLWAPNLGLVSGRDVELNILDLPAGSIGSTSNSEFYNNSSYDGVLIERKVQNADDSTYVSVSEFKKSYIKNVVDSGTGENPVFRDVYSIPNTTYTYKLSTYITIDDVLYLESSTVDITSPPIEGPTNLVAQSSEGKVALTWTSNQSGTIGGLSLGYINYEGYELTRTPVGGGTEIVIATLSGNIENHNDFISNPVYDIFFDTNVDVTYEYNLSAFLIIDGIKYYADPITTTGMPTPGSTEEPLPFNFEASNDLPGHVKLCWDWTATKHSEFVIFRDSVLLAILPHTARSVYDYDATPGVTTPYTIQSRFLGVFSQEVRTEGLIPSFTTISGRVYNDITGQGLEGVNVSYTSKEDTFLINGVMEHLPSGYFQDAAVTDATGRYHFEGAPYFYGLVLDVDATRINTDFDPSLTSAISSTSDTILITSENEYNLDFVDYSSEQLEEGVAQVTAVNAVSNVSEMNVQILWSINNTNYDGFKVYRGDNVLGEVMAGADFVFIDSTAFPGIQFPYGVQAFQDTGEGRVYTEIISSSATFPAVPPVINLTATPITANNTMLIQWSHPLDNHDWYTISRNGLYMDNVEAGTQMLWIDSTGVPGIVYNYEIIAVNGNYVSEPVAIEAAFKGVGEVTNLLAITYDHLESCVGVPNTVNYIDVIWNYIPGGADGFEVYRDDELIAEVDSVVLRFGNKPLIIGDTIFNNGVGSYRDYTGVPGVEHTYQVLSYVIRNGTRYSSGIQELALTASEEFPTLAKVDNLSIAQNNVLGSVQISFSYETDVVKGFELLRDGVVLDTLFSIDEMEFVYQDITGTPAQSYEYAVRVYDIIDGSTYYSPDGCEATVEFPIVPVPQSLHATQGTFSNHIDVTWLFDADSFVDSFHLENITLGTSHAFGRGGRTHADIVNYTEESQFEYRIRASRSLNNNVIYSDWSSTVIGWAGKQVTGNEDNDLNGSCNSNMTGHSVDIEGDWAVAGVVAGTEAINIYRMIDGGFSLFQTIESPLANSDADFGYAVAIHSDYIVVSAPEENQAFMYHYDGIRWGNPQLLSVPSSVKYGHSVDVNNGQCIISDPLKSFGAYSGEVYIYELENDIWHLKLTQNAGNTHRYGYGVAIENDLALASFHWINQNSEGVSFLAKENGSWGLSSVDPFPMSTKYTENNDLTTDNIDLDKNTLVIGDRVISNNNGRVRVATLENGGVSTIYNLYIPGNMPNGFVGHSVAVSTIPSPEEDIVYIAVGAPGISGSGTSGVGKSYLVSAVGTTFTILSEYQTTFDDPSDATDEQGGWSVGLSQSTMMIGTPKAGVLDHGEVDFHNLLRAPISVTATDGISSELDPTRVTIDWVYEGNKDLLQGFNIYRDEEFLIYRDKGQTTEVGDTYVGQWEDNTGGPGQPYVYSVRSVNNNIPFETYNTSDEGHTTANGKIQGSVVTAGNNVAVPGVTIVATGMVDGEIYTYTGTTFPNGEYILSDVYYDHDDDMATDYVVEATYFDHEINPTGTGIATLNSLLDPTVGTVSFVDETAYVIYGKVEQPLVDCAIEGIKVTPIINGTPGLLSQATTDSDGNYAIVINPNDPTLQSIAIRIENEAVDGMDTLYYGFSPDADTLFTDFVGFPFATEINYIDTLTYPVNIRVKNTCDDPISVTKWDVRIRTLDGCFDEIYQTNSSGDLDVDLLPLNYEMNVVASSVPSTVNQVAIDYFANFPVKLDLFDLHRDSTGVLTPEEISDLAASQFTYHVAPNIEVTGFTNILCDTEVAILQQGEEYTLSFDISEQFGSKECPVTEGKVSILNPASDQSGSTVIPYDDFLEQFETYTFTAGGPNQIRPHFYTITVDYLSDDDVFLGRTQHLAFVEGSVGLPGAGIITDPVDGNNAVPLPVMVLRDPPGDGSSSYISGGQSMTYETELVDEFGGETEFSVSAELGLFGANTEFGFTNVLGGSDEYTNTYTNTLSLSQTISTFDPVDIQDETLTGVNADIVVGQGLVMSYGKVYEYSIECGAVSVVEKNRISPGAASTTWHYTISQINNIILGYENDSLKIQNGTLKLTEGSREITRDQSLEKISSYLENWRQVLVFHSRETVPMYNLCTSVPPISGEYPSAAGEIEKWKADVCAVLGTGLNETFQLADSIKWDDPLMDKYSAASYAIKNMASGLTGQAPIWHYTTNYQSIIDLATSLGQAGPYGQAVENITVGGGIAIDRSIQNVSSSNRAHASNFYTTNEVSAAVGFDDEVTIVAGGFAGTGVGVFVGGFTGVLEQSSVVKTKAGIKGKFEFKMSNTTSEALENEIETGYTLSDDDSVDAFSVTVIQPIAQNQTPYFAFFGGFTSCPAEEGALAVDNPKIAIVQGGGTTDEILIQNVAEDELIQLEIIVENQTPISSNPEREVKVYLDAGSNINGAFLTLNGVDLNNGELVLTLDAFDPTSLSLVIERGPLFYEYDNLQLVIEPTCDSGISESVDISVRYNSPCSPVTLVQPLDGWLINDNVQPLVIAMQDYDPYNEVLEKAVLEYRKLGTAMGWDIVNNTQILQGNEILADSLASYNEGLDATIQNPKYYFHWSIPDNFVDGEYEVRVRMKCDFSNTYSNAIKWNLARNEIGLFGTPQPSDKVWTNGDEISFSFNLPLDCGYIQGPTDYIEDFISITDITTGLDVPFSVSCFNNKLQFVLTEEMSTYDGHFLTMTVDEVPAETGNISTPHEWTFRVITQEVYWANGDTIKLRMYQDETTTFTSSLINTSGIMIGQILGFAAEDLSFDSWLQVINPENQPFDLSPEGRDVIFGVDANIALGQYNETINVTGLSGNAPQLHVQLEVLTRPPNWEVDPGIYTQSMNVVVNWKFDNQDIADISTDTTDVISVWIDSEIRGVANIQSSDGFHYAYITVYGDLEDTDQSLEFRVWDGDPGTEYDGHIFPAIDFVKDIQVGTVGSPSILDVNAEDDLARYIPLRGGGWTGFSLFTDTDSMSVQHKLRSLRYEMEGDIILTGDKFAQYNDSIGWYSFGDQQLTELNTSEGYMIYLQGPDDTLRVSGALSMADNIDLHNGWNWMGFPFENGENVNLSFDYPATNGLDILKKDTPLPGETSQNAQYNPGNASWQGNLPSMESNNLYKLYVSNPNPNELDWLPDGTDDPGAPTTEPNGNNIADPDDQTTWSVPHLNTDAVMPIIAQVLKGGEISLDANDRVAIFENNILRGYAAPIYLPEFDVYEFSILVEEGLGVYDIKFYDADVDAIFTSTNSLVYTASGQGTYELPYLILFDDGSCPSVLTIGPGGIPFALDKTFEASQEIRVTGNLNIPAGVEIILSAPKVTIVDQLDTGTGAQVIVRPDGCN